MSKDQENKSKKVMFFFKDKQDLTIFLSCLFTSFIFWLLLSLSEDYTDILKLDVKYKNLPENKTVVNKLPDEVTVGVSGYGFSLLGQKLGFGKGEITIDASKITPSTSGDRMVYHWVNSQHLAEFTKQIKHDIAVNTMYPDSIRIEMENIVRKKVKVRHQLSLKNRGTLDVVGGIQMTPDSVTIVGASSLVKGIDYVTTDTMTISLEEGVVKKTVGISKIENISIEERAVLLNLNVQAIVRQKISVDIETKNVPDNVELKLLPSKVDIGFVSSNAFFESVDSSDFRVVVDYENINVEDAKADVALLSFPSRIKHPSLTPAKVQFIIRFKDE